MPNSVPPHLRLLCISLDPCSITKVPYLELWLRLFYLSRVHGWAWRSPSRMFGDRCCQNVHMERTLWPSLGLGRVMILSASLLGHGENQRVSAIKYSNYSMESSDKATRNWASGSHLLRAGESRRRQQP